MKKYTIELANKVLELKKLDFLKVSNIDSNIVEIIDNIYGKYYIDIKCLSPKSLIPLHKIRKHKNKIDKFKKEYVGKTINEILIVDAFYGPDRGYKNRSFYMEYKSPCCNNISVGTRVYILKHKKTISCVSCCKIHHGERTKVEGKLKKRTSTYNTWQTNKNKLSEKYQDFSVFKEEVGDKPTKKSKLDEINGKLVWINTDISEDYELNLIANSIRQVFRHSNIYRSCLQNARIETNEGTKYLM